MTDRETGLRMFERMLTIRLFEQRVSRMYADGDVPGFVHLSVGQEAVAVGACWPLRRTDVITSTHRGHGHCLAKGMDPAAMFAELMGRDTGSNRGRGGSMHIADPDLGIFGANGIVAGGIPIAAGAATAARLRGHDQVVVSFFGDGAVAHGAFHEGVNLAALWRLPVIFLCENNGFAEFSRTADQHPVSLRDRAVGYGLAYEAVDGNDVTAVADLVGRLVEDIRVGGGPALVEATTYRWHGHYEGDPQRYRDDATLAYWQDERDPIGLQRERLLDAGVPPAELASVEAAVAARLDRDLRTASSAPSPSGLTDFVYRPPARPAAGPATGERTYRTMDAIHDALALSLDTDPDVFLAGIDVGEGGNVFGLTRGLRAKWPDRVLDTPISETAIVGLGVGAAMAGMRPVVEIMYLDFVGVCLDQIMNQAAKLPFMTGGRSAMALTIRTQFGVGRSSGSQHSQSLEALLAHIPGLKVVMPSDPADTYGLLRASILDPNPVVFIENRLLYGRKGARPDPGDVAELGVARVVRPGTDVTVVAWSAMVHECLTAAEILAAEGISLEVIDLRTVAPIDFATIHESVSRTSRLLIAQQAVLRHGLGAEIAARMCVDGFWDLDAPITRLGGPFTPVPYAPNLESAWLPDARSVVAAARDLVAF
ncbi:MAG TPA: dehydrogenase E1 component subunit alpha/beta [Pseudonocardiaceae bacterium]|nr:dehydrogenase E1 component subunit alpha/beta [Pseudonocardiaceae bacterium]